MRAQMSGLPNTSLSALHSQLDVRQSESLLPKDSQAGSSAEWRSSRGRLLIDRLVPIHGKVAIDNVHAIFRDFAAVGKIIAAGVFVDGAAATQLGEFVDQPG